MTEQLNRTELNLDSSLCFIQPSILHDRVFMQVNAVILEPRKIKSDTVSPSISHEVMGPDAMIFVF